MDNRDRRISDQLVRLVQIVFGLVLAQGLLLHRDVIQHPLTGNNWLPTMALLGVLVTTAMSWVDWHVTMELRPYNFNRGNRHHTTEKLRLTLDLIVVVFYAYLLFTVEQLKAIPTGSIANYLLGFPLVFAAYLLSGLARQLSHGRIASNIRPILLFGALYYLLYLVYDLVYFLPSLSSRLSRLWLNGGFVAAGFGLMVCYRIVRSYIVRHRNARRAGLTVAIDLDGVLANQIDGLIPRVRERLGMTIRYDDVTAWRLPLGESDIAKEIALALEDPDYILSMPLHLDARECVDRIYDRNRVIMLTARPSHTKLHTEQWLENHGFSYDKLVSAKEESKSFSRADVLIDDYIGNIREFLTNTDGVAVLVEQPWNREANGELLHWIEAGRLRVVKHLLEAVGFVDEIRRGLLHSSVVNNLQN